MIDDLAMMSLPADSRGPPAGEPTGSGVVSVIIAVKNGAHFIGEAVESALAQGPPLADIVVVDDGSTDETGSIVAAFGDPRVKLIANQARGVSAARNAGVQIAQGNWLLFLDADDRLAPDAVAVLIDAARANPGAVAAYGDYERVDADGRRSGRRFLIRRRRKPSGRILGQLMRGNFIINGGVLICSRAAFMDAGGFDPQLSLSEDWHLWCKLAARGPYAFVGQHVLDYRVHASSVMMGQRRTFENFRPALDAIFTDPVIASSMGPKDMADGRRQAEINVLTYCAAQAVRNGDRREAMRLFAAAVRRDVRKLPYVLSRIGGAAVGM